MIRPVDPSLNRRTLRRELRRARESAGLTQAQAADELQWSVSKMIRVEAGQVGVSLSDVRRLAKLYSITDVAMLQVLERAARGSKGSSWWAKYHDVLSPQFAQYLGLEQAADQIAAFHPIVIPGHLQTSAYATALLRPRVREDDRRLAGLVDLREERNDYLLDSEATKRFVIAEGALELAPGDSGVMREQLGHLLDLAARTRVEIAVLPKNFGFHYSTLGSFVLLKFADDAEDQLYLEHTTGSMTSGNDFRLLAEYQECFEAFFAGALVGKDACARIKRAMTEAGS